MKRFTFLYSALTVSFLIITYSFIQPDKFIKKQGFVYAPSGTYFVGNEKISIMGFYISASEITNLQYRTFLDDLTLAGKTEEFELAKVDGEKWKIPNSSMDEISKIYHVDKKYDNYPVVNISQEGAELYCKWLQEKFKKEGINVTIRLPLEVEWKYAAKGADNANVYAWEGSLMKNKKGAYLANYKTEKISDDGGYITTITHSYKPNNFGLYNLCGNAAEWISEPGRTKGGSWWSEAQYLKIESEDEYRGSAAGSPYIGFRPIFTWVQQN